MAAGRTTIARPGADAFEVARALADSTRLRIFLALRQQERCVREIVAAEGIAQPLVSHHLRILAGAGLVEARRADRFHLYAVSPAGMRSALAALGDVLGSEELDPLALPGGNDSCCQ